MQGWKSFSRIEWTLILGLMAAISLTAVAALYPANAFQRPVHPGMTQAEVRSHCGSPDHILEPGDELSRWGNEKVRAITAETWVYSVFPRSQNRFVLTFEEHVLTDIEHHQN